MNILDFEFKTPPRIAFIGDVHIGAKFCQKSMYRYYLDLLAKDPNTYLITMGDMVEAITIKDKRHINYNLPSDSRRSGIEEQILEVRNSLKKFDGRILVNMIGNHEESYYRFNQLDITHLLSDELGGELGGYVATVRLKIKDNTYKLMIRHGDSGSSKTYTKIKKVTDMAEVWPDANLYAMGHVHEKQAIYDAVLDPNFEGKVPSIRDRLFLLTGSFTSAYVFGEYPYTEKRLVKPCAIGFPAVTFGDRMKVEMF